MRSAIVKVPARTISYSKTYNPNLPMCDQPNVPDPWVEDQVKAAIKGGYLNKKN